MTHRRETEDDRRRKIGLIDVIDGSNYPQRKQSKTHNIELWLQSDKATMLLHISCDMKALSLVRYLITALHYLHFHQRNPNYSTS